MSLKFVDNIECMYDPTHDIYYDITVNVITAPAEEDDVSFYLDKINDGYMTVIDKGPGKERSFESHPGCIVDVNPVTYEPAWTKSSVFKFIDDEED